MSKAKAPMKQAAPEPERLIYCGPNIPGGALQRYTVFKGGLPAHLGELFEKCPAIKQMFVPVADLARVDGAIGTKGTPEHSAYQAVLQFTAKGGA